MKCILFCLAEHHNRSSRLAIPSQELLVAESLTSKDTVQRSIAYLERTGILEVIRPDRQGRGQLTAYRFIELDRAAAGGINPPQKWTAEQPERRGAPCPPFVGEEKAKEGEHRAPPSGANGGGQKGSKQPEKGEQKGSNGHNTIRKNQESKATKYKEGAQNRARPPKLSQAERDSLDLKRWRVEMAPFEKQNFTYDPDPEQTWRRNAKQAAYNAGVAPARLVELLKQHLPRDHNVDLLYPELTKKPPDKKRNLR
jgi:hypothetical protein